MDNSDLVQLINNARNGCRESMTQLTELFQDEIYRYIYRMTLNEDLTNDLRQDTLLQMVQSLDNLRDVDKFRPWLYRTAWGKVKNYYRTRKRKRTMSIDDNNLVDALEGRCIEGLKELIDKEIAETLVRTIYELDPRHRSVLVLRCYDNMSYEEIASTMDCSETTVRVMFFRAKNQLRQMLKRKGITTLPMFLGVLGLFGQITSRADAAVQVSASALKVGGLGTAIGWILSKTGAWVLSLIAGVAIVSGTVLTQTDKAHWTNQNSDSEVKSFHFTKHAWKRDTLIPTTNLRMGRSLSKGAYEQWFFFPEGVEGPLFKMVQRWDPKIENKLCGWLLNEEGQHYYHSGENMIFLLNSPLAKLRTARFPSDSREFCDFLDSVEGVEEGLEYVRDPKTGLLMEIVDRRFANAKDFVSGVERNTFDETEFGNFSYQWDKNAQFVDQRDSIHQQGWTLFEITGTLNGQYVYGRCRIPFVYGKREAFPPLLKLLIGNQYSIIDSPEGAFVLDSNSKVIHSYPSESFFKGLLRPWYGLHTIDLLRREAAKCRIPFELEDLDFDGYSFQRRILTLHQAPGHDTIKISFDIDIGKNEIEQVVFKDNSTVLGTLNFSYLSDPESIDNMMEMPTVKRRWFSEKEPPGILWLFELAQGTLSKQQQ